MKKIFNELIIPASMLTALIIGAGFFSLPYVFAKSGIILSLGYLGFFTLVISAIHLMYGDLVEHTRGEHGFMGYARIYLGQSGFYISLITTFLGIILSLLIYLVLSAKFIGNIFDFGNGLIPALIFSILATIPIFFGIRKIADLGFVLTLGKVLMIFAVFFIGVKSFSLSAISDINLSNIFLPYSVILFSLYGRSAISAIKSYFRANHLSHEKFKAALILGTFAPALLYTLFVFGVLGISGENVSIDSVSGFKSVPWLEFLGSCLGLISIWAAYIFLSFELNRITVDDLKLRNFSAQILVASLPIALYLLGFTSLLGLIGIAGGVFIALESIMVIAMWLKLKPRKILISASAFLLALIFAAAIFYELLHL